MLEPVIGHCHLCSTMWHFDVCSIFKELSQRVLAGLKLMNSAAGNQLSCGACRRK